MERISRPYQFSSDGTSNVPDTSANRLPRRPNDREPRNNRDTESDTFCSHREARHTCDRSIAIDPFSNTSHRDRLDAPRPALPEVALEHGPSAHEP